MKRRDFVKTGIAAAGATAIYHTNVHARVLGANDRINIGCIGIGGRCPIIGMTAS